MEPFQVFGAGLLFCIVCWRAYAVARQLRTGRAEAGSGWGTLRSQTPLRYWVQIFLEVFVVVIGGVAIAWWLIDMPPA